MHDFSAFYSPFPAGFILAFLPLLIVVALWTIILKGYALWYAARGSQKGWFIALLIVNTLGILEIIYIFAFSQKAETATNTEKKPEALLLIEKQEAPAPEKIVLGIKNEEVPEKKEEEEEKETTKSDLDDSTQKS